MPVDAKLAEIDSLISKLKEQFDPQILHQIFALIRALDETIINAATKTAVDDRRNDIRQLNRTAITRYTLIITSGSQTAVDWAHRGHSYFYNQDFAQAIADFLEAIKLGVKNYQIYRNLGQSYAALDKHDEAAAAYEQARLFPSDAENDIETSVRLAYSYQLSDKKPQASVLYRSLLERTSQETDSNERKKFFLKMQIEIYKNLGVIDLNLQSYFSAIKHFKAALLIRSEPLMRDTSHNFAFTHHSLGVAYVQAKPNDDNTQRRFFRLAQVHFHLAISANLPISDSYNYLGNLFAEQGHSARALECYNQGLEKFPHDPLLTSSRNILLAQYPKKIEPAEPTEAKANPNLTKKKNKTKSLPQLDLNSEFDRAVQCLAIFRDDPTNSIKKTVTFTIIQNALKFDQNNIPFNKLLAEYYYLADEHQKTVDQCSIALTLSPESHTLRDLRGFGLLVLGRHKEAIQDFEIVINNPPAQIETYINLADCYYRQKQFEKTLFILRKASNIFGNNPEITTRVNDIYSTFPSDKKADVHHIRGLAYEQQGLFKEAENQFKTAIYLCPNSAYVYINLSNHYSRTNNTQEALKVLDDAIKTLPDNAALKEYKSKILTDNQTTYTTQLSQTSTSNAAILARLSAVYPLQKPGVTQKLTTENHSNRVQWLEGRRNIRLMQK